MTSRASESGDPNRRDQTGSGYVATPTAADVAAVRRASPLAADLTIRCDKFDVAAGVLASEPTLELERSEAADALRAFLAHDPWSGMGSVHPGGWMLLARDADTIVVGQREGVIGLGAVVTLHRDGQRFAARSMGGWRLSGPDRNENVEACRTGAARGNEVTVHWQCGQDMARVVDRVLARVAILEEADQVHFLLSSVPNPDRPPARGGWHVGTGATATSTFLLSNPLGHRALLDDADVPARPVRLTLD